MRLDKFQPSNRLTKLVREIESNGESKFVWFGYKNKHGVQFEIGGNHKILRAHVVSDENNKLLVNENKFLKTRFTISTDYVHPIDGVSYDKELFLRTLRSLKPTAYISPIFQERIEYDLVGSKIINK